MVEVDDTEFSQWIEFLTIAVTQHEKDDPETAHDFTADVLASMRELYTEANEG